MIFFLIEGAVSFYTILLTIAILSSWFPEIQDYAIIRWIKACTDPYLNIFRQIIPPLGPLDLSPIVAFMALRFIANMVRGMF